jgi:hypothetical protein
MDYVSHTWNSKNLRGLFWTHSRSRYLFDAHGTPFSHAPNARNYKNIFTTNITIPHWIEYVPDVYPVYPHAYFRRDSITRNANKIIQIHRTRGRGSICMGLILSTGYWFCIQGVYFQCRNCLYTTV